MNTDITQRTNALFLSGHLITLQAVGYDFKNPVKWASGTRNPFYVDGRILQSDHHVRGILGKALASLLAKEEQKSAEYVFGIPNAGIAPATLLAMEIQVPLLIKIGTKYYSMGNVKKLRQKFENLSYGVDVIAGTIPLGIPFGIIMATKSKLPFLFVREKPKDHGKNRQIEGVLKSGNRAALVDYEFAGIENYTKNAIDALKESGITVSVLIDSMINGHIDHVLTEVDISGKNIVVVEDVVSTGESTLKEIQGMRQQGATIHTACSFFGYGFDETVRSFEKNNCELRSALDFLTLLSMYCFVGEISDVDRLHLLEWYHNQPTWGDKNGFPSDKK